MNVQRKITLRMSGFLNKHYPFIKALKCFLFNSNDYFQQLNEPQNIFSCLSRSAFLGSGKLACLSSTSLPRTQALSLESLFPAENL